MNNTKAIEKLKESKEHLDLELISQEEYDKIKEELRPFIVLTDDKKSEKINEKLNKLTDKNKIDVTQIEKEPKPLSPPVNLNDIGYLSPMKQWSWTGYWWIDISEMFEGATTKKVLESVENSTTSSNATEQKKTSKWVYISGVLFILMLIGSFLPPTDTSSSTSSFSSSSQSCEWCGKKFTGRGYTHLFGNVQRVKEGQEGYATECSRSCATKHFRNL